MEPQGILDLNRRLDNLDAQVRAIAEHLEIVLMYKPQKYDVVSKKELEKEMKESAIEV